MVKAFVVAAAGYEPSDRLAEEIMSFVREHHSAYAYPRLIEFVPDLPKTLTGKIRRIELREREALCVSTRSRRYLTALPAAFSAYQKPPNSEAPTYEVEPLEPNA